MIPPGGMGMSTSNDAPNHFDIATLREGLRPFRLHYFSRLRSTSDHAAVLRRRGELFAPAVVLTGNQTAGRGRAGRTWWSGPGSLTATFALPAEEHMAAHQVPLVAGLAVRNAVARLSGCEEIQLKWPNDVLHRGRKLAGLLCERINRVDLVGIGLNVNLDPRLAPAGIAPYITSMNVVAGHAFPATAVLVAIATELHAMFLRRRHESFVAIVREYERSHALTGRRISVSNAGEAQSIQGICEGLDDTGRLLLRETDRLRRLVSGHVELV